jgi:peptidoglycan/LPS O-acetylase OafA/YrhL
MAAAELTAAKIGVRVARAISAAGWPAGITAVLCAYFFFVPYRLHGCLLRACYFGLSIGTLLFVLAALYGSGMLVHCLTWRPMRWLGNFSYSYYLIHALAIKAVAQLIDAVCHRQPNGFVFICGTAISLMDALVAGAVLFVTVERPFSIADRNVKSWQAYYRHVLLPALWVGHKPAFSTALATSPCKSKHL